MVAFTGDGGFLMTIAELQTAQRENLPSIELVLDDQEIGLIRVKQEIKGIAPLQSKRTTVIGVRIDASGYVAPFNALREL